MSCYCHFCIFIFICFKTQQGNLISLSRLLSRPYLHQKATLYTFPGFKFNFNQDPPAYSSFNILSVTGLRAFPGVVSYNMSKAALDMLTRNYKIGRCWYIQGLCWTCLQGIIRSIDVDIFEEGYLDMLYEQEQRLGWWCWWFWKSCWQGGRPVTCLYLIEE